MNEQPVWGEGPSREQVPRPARRPKPGPASAAGPTYPTPPPRDVDQDDEGERADRLGLIAVWCGIAGLILVGILATIVTGVLAAEAGRRARERGTSLRIARYGMALAALDGVWFVVLHLHFDIPVWLG